MTMRTIFLVLHILAVVTIFPLLDEFPQHWEDDSLRILVRVAMTAVVFILGCETGRSLYRRQLSYRPPTTRYNRDTGMIEQEE